MRHAALAGLLIAGAWTMPAAADDIDHPTQQRSVLRGTSRTSGAITEDVGFPAHTYLATKDGFARIELDTENLADRPHDNGGRAWRAYLRVITIPDAEHRSEGWSTNGEPGGRRGARASLIVRVAAGESFTIVATLAQNVVKQQPAAVATYRLAATELSPIRAPLAIAALVAGTSPPVRAQPRQDAIDRPTDTHVTLVAGLWHDDVLKPGEGWHRYQFTAADTGAIAFQMQAPAAQTDLWPYLLIMDATNHDRKWAGVGNRKTNLCEVIVEVEAGKRYDVIATSQQNTVLPAGQRQRTSGPYTVAALPIRLTD